MNTLVKISGPDADDALVRHARNARISLESLCKALEDEHALARANLGLAAELLRGVEQILAAGRDLTPEGRGLSPWQVRKVTRYIASNLHRSITNEDLASVVRLTPSHFGRAFRRSMGEPPHEYVIRQRVRRAQALMLTSGANLSAIALECGLADQSHLTRLFRKLVGMSPSEWRRCHAHVEPAPRQPEADAPLATAC